METQTICSKCLTTPIMVEDLQETSIRFAEACNYILRVAIDAKTHNSLKLHHLCYAEIRTLFGLSANLAVRAIRLVAGSMTKLKGKGKRLKEFTLKSIDYE